MSVEKRSTRPVDPIAIIGIGCRFPGDADDPASFWNLLWSGTDAVSEIPEDRWNIHEFYHPSPGMPGKTYSRWGGFLRAIDQFEPECFGIAPREAAHMDPQQRLLLEVCWEALEDAGYASERLAGNTTGVFIGVSTSDYAMLQSWSDGKGPVDSHAATGEASSIVANRISYCLNLHGPSLAVDTACSSSLVATDLACQSLWNDRCDYALAGGVNVIISPSTFVVFCAASMLSPEGRCKAFDAKADGFVRGEGAGVVVLKKLSRALADGDSIYALIAGSAVNQDGRTNGIGVPSQSAQEVLIRAALQQAAIDPGQVHYVEAHGTGTAVGDPIEARAIGNALSAHRPSGEHCIIGSVKTNVGHLEAAAGIAGIIKTALVLQHRAIPPNLHFKEPNPNIPFEALRLRVPVRPEAWGDGDVAIAGVNSFGIGGTNAHVLMTEYRQEGAVQLGDGALPAILPLSARSPEALQTLAGSYRNDLEHAFHSGKWSLPAVCYTAALGRSHLDHRLALVVDGEKDLERKLDAFLANEKAPGVVTGRCTSGQSLRPVFVFSGQGPQWWAMGRELFDQVPAFRRAIEQCDALLGQHAEWSLLEELRRDEGTSRIHETAITQPALFSLQLGLLAMWREWGIEPQAVVGHSVGEVAAAYAAGALDLPDAVRVIFHRGRCMDRASSKGRMLAARLSETEAIRLIGGYGERVALAAINSPSSVTLSGDPMALEEIARSLTGRGIFCRLLQTGYAFHSSQMDPVRQELLESLGEIHAGLPEVTMLSTVTGRSVASGELAGSYWWENVRQPVRFAQAIRALARDGYDTYVEVGPHPVLAGPIAECLLEEGGKGTVHPSLRREEPEREQMLAALGQLYVKGYPVDFARMWPRGARRVRLPRYPWQHRSFWHEPEESRARRLGKVSHPLLGSRRPSAHPTWQNRLDTHLLSYLDDHRVRGNVVVPAAAYIEMALAATRELSGRAACILEDVRFEQPLLLRESDEATPILFTHSPQDGSFAVHSRQGSSDDSWLGHARGYLYSQDGATPSDVMDLEALKHALPEELSPEDCYRRFEAVGLAFGKSLRRIQRVWRKDFEALARLRAAAADGATWNAYCVHPAVLDATFQVLIGALPRALEKNRSLYLPVFVQKVGFYRAPKSDLWCHVRMTRADKRALEADIAVYGDAGELLLEFKGYLCQSVEQLRANDLDSMDNWFYELTWRNTSTSTERPTKGGALLPPGSQLEVPIAARIESPTQPELLEGRLRLNELAVAYIVGAFDRMGAVFQPDRELTLDAIITRHAVEPRYRRLVRTFMQALRAEGLLEHVSDDRWHLAKPPPRYDTARMWQEALTRCPSFLAELTLLGRCGARLDHVLQGEIDPAELLTEGGPTAALEHFYQDAPYSRLAHTMTRSVLESALRRLPAGRAARILEIGAGTAGLTAYTLPVLRPDSMEYVFSDKSDVLFHKAEQKLRGYPSLSFRVLDVEKDPLEQGFDAASFDVILASDVLYATGDLRQTLRHLATLLTPEGLLVFVEPRTMMPWIDVVFGLTDEWWRFTDFDLRRDHPLLEPAQWRDLLEEIGFGAVEPVRLPGDAEKVDRLMMVARGPRLLYSLEPRENRAEASTSRSPADARSGWIVFADSGDLGRELGARLADRGELCALVTPGNTFGDRGKQRFQVSPDDPRHMDALLRALSSVQPPWRGVIHLWSLDATPPEAIGTETLRRGEALGCHSVMHLVQALARIETQSERTSLILVTRGAHPLGDSGRTPDPTQFPVIGLGRVIMAEYPQIECKLVDLCFDDRRRECAALLTELAGTDGEEEVVWRADGRFVPRLDRARESEIPALDPGSDPANPRPFRLQVSTAGVIDKLAMSETRREEPDPGEVVIEVRAASLNFRDVMKVLGLYPADTPDSLVLGDECAGRIIAVGPGVTEFEIGDEVCAIAPGSFASYVRTAAVLVMHKPKHMSYEEAATLPVPFLTAYYALHVLGRIAPGERVLIHSAAGGVGLAALQISQKAGAEVFATAGSREKRDVLQLLGVQHAMNSRSLSFADEVMTRTGGRGVDIVLNSLSGQAIAKGISCLAPYGRFLEIGKRDIYQDSRIGLWAFRKNLSFFAIDLARLMIDKPAAMRALLDNLSKKIDEGSFHALPYRLFPVTRVRDGFRHMAQARHIGKIVVSMEAADLPIKPLRREVKFREEATYLITGGFGGFGSAIAKWAVDRGARNLVLVGRGGADSDQAKALLAQLAAAGARARGVKADITNRECVAELFTDIETDMPPVRGLFHTAMVLDDGVLLHLTAERFHRVMAPKVEGTWNLHTATLHRHLDFFVLFSSVSSLVGNQGQANYVAANAFLDGFAHYRRSLGLPAMTVNWGALAEVGYLSRNREVAELLARRGFMGLTPDQATEALGRLLTRNPVQIGVMKTDWHRVARSGAQSPSPQRLSLLAVSRDDETERNDVAFLRDQLREVREEEREMILRAFIGKQVESILGASEARLDCDQSLHEVGLDSLMAVELRNRLETDLAVSLPTGKLMQGPMSIRRLAEIILEQLNGTAPGPVAGAGGLVPLRKDGARPPLFCIHPAEGYVKVYEELVARLSADQPAFGIQSGLLDGGKTYDSIDAMALEYTRSVLQQAPQGPYRLLGYSLGGFIAMAMANILETRGETVEFVGLIECDIRCMDAAFPRHQVLCDLITGVMEEELNLPAASSASLTGAAMTLSRELMELPQTERADAIVRWLSERSDLTGVPTAMLTDYLRMIVNHVTLIDGFEPQGVSAPVFVWKGACRSRPWGPDALSWEMYARSGTREAAIEASHHGIMHSPAVDVLAVQLDRALQSLTPQWKAVPRRRGGNP